MSRNQRLGLLALAIAAVVVVFVIASPGKKHEKHSGVVDASIQVVHGKSPSGVVPISLNRGQTLHLVVSSNDTSGEIHFHGYDVHHDVAPGKPAVFDIKATITGGFIVEVEKTGTQIGQVTVNQ
jgi:hypothetical protein